MTGDGTMGILEVMILGAMGWFIAWILFIFLKTIIYAMLSGSTAFASYYFMSLPVDPAVAKPFMSIGSYGISSIEVVVILLLGATFLLGRKLVENWGLAGHRFKAAFWLS